MKIINYGHACFKVIDGDVSVIFDPYRDDSVPGLTLPEGLEADYVFCSHEHDDHCAVEKVKLSGKKPPLKMKEVVLNHDNQGGKLRGKTIARILYFDDYSICHLGDCGDVNEVLENKDLDDIDVVLCPINGFYTICAMDALRLKRNKNWRLLIPMHYQIKYPPNFSTGYSDGGQINIFTKSIERYANAPSSGFEVSEKYFAYNFLIFENK